MYMHNCRVFSRDQIWVSEPPISKLSTRFVMMIELLACEVVSPTAAMASAAESPSYICFGSVAFIATMFDWSNCSKLDVERI
jgi:hypothetical protein